jgi:two-component system, chemotaxis family, protein-glutamate methylesterase/glutaminase
VELPVVSALPSFRAVVIAASAGGLPALTCVLAQLPREFPLPIAVVQHIDPHRRSLMAEILGRHTSLRVKHVYGPERLAPGLVYFARAGHHLEIGLNGTILLTRADPVHHVRPAADRLFESAAAMSPPVIAVVLSGTGRDGARGVTAIKASAGVTIAQDEESSAFFGMPLAAIETGAVDFVLPLDQIASKLVELSKRV